MKVEVKEIKKNESLGLNEKGTASILLNDSVLIKEVKIMSDEKGLYVAMPYRVIGGKASLDVIHPTELEARDQITYAVLSAYSGKEYVKGEVEPFMVTRVSLDKMMGDKYKAVATVVLNNSISMHYVYLIEETKNSKRTYDVILSSILTEKGSSEEVVFIQDDILRDEIVRKVLQKYVE